MTRQHSTPAPRARGSARASAPTVHAWPVRRSSHHDVHIEERGRTAAGHHRDAAPAGSGDRVGHKHVAREDCDRRRAPGGGVVADGIAAARVRHRVAARDISAVSRAGLERQPHGATGVRVRVRHVDVAMPAGTRARARNRRPSVSENCSSTACVPQAHSGQTDRNERARGADGAAIPVTVSGAAGGVVAPIVAAAYAEPTPIAATASVEA